MDATPFPTLTPPALSGAAAVWIACDHPALTFAAPLFERRPVGGIASGPGTPDYDRCYQHVVALLRPGEDGAPATLDPDASVMLDRALLALLTNPRLEELSYAADAESWFARVLAASVPRADPVLLRVANRFGWLVDGDHVGREPAIAFIVERIGTLDFVVAMDRPGHRYARAWRELKKPAVEGSRRGLFVGKRNIHALLSTLRQRHPDAEGALDCYRVQLWEQPRVMGPGRWMWAFLIFALIRVVVSLGQGSSDAPTPAEAAYQAEGPTVSSPTQGATEDPSDTSAEYASSLTDRDSDITHALRKIADGIVAADVNSDHPAIYDALAKKWRIAKDEGKSIAICNERVRQFIAARFQAAIVVARYDDIRAWRELQLRELTAAGARGDAACDLYLRGDLEIWPFLSEADREAARTIRMRIALSDPHPDRLPVDRPATFAVPAEVVEQARRRSGLSGTEMKAAMRGAGTPRARCQQSLAFLQTVLALPRAEALPLLRKM